MSTTNVYMQYSLVQPDALISTGESEEAFYLPETFGSQNKMYQKRGFRENKPNSMYLENKYSTWDLDKLYIFVLDLL